MITPAALRALRLVFTRQLRTLAYVRAMAHAREAMGDDISAIHIRASVSCGNEPERVAILMQPVCAGSYARGIWHCAECGADKPNECERKTR